MGNIGKSQKKLETVPLSFFRVFYPFLRFLGPLKKEMAKMVQNLPIFDLNERAKRSGKKT